MHASIWFDGACMGNPGPGGGGAYLEIDGQAPHRVYRRLSYCTNNKAEYTGLILGLYRARMLGATSVSIRGDSKLVIEQVRGNWKVKAQHLRPYRDEAKRLLRGLEVRVLEWIPRQKNGEADAASRGIDALRL